MAFAPALALRSLASSQRAGRLGHAYLVSGGSDVSRREVAAGLVSIARGLEPSGGDFPQHPDVHLVEPESKARRIVSRQIEELIRELSLRSLEAGGVRAGVLLDADRIVTEAANKFLKTLEEPPPHSLLVLVTSRPEALLDTIVSRCIRVELMADATVRTTPREEALHTLLEAHAGRIGENSVAGAFGMLREFQRLLVEAKAEIRGEQEDEFAEEEERYDRRDYGDWLEEREAWHKTQAETRYLGERDRLIAVISRWWGAQLHASVRRADASGLETHEILRRLEAIEKLHEHLARNVQEAMALEAAFLSAFA